MNYLINGLSFELYEPASGIMSVVPGAYHQCKKLSDITLEFSSIAPEDTAEVFVLAKNSLVVIVNKFLRTLL
jgi:hypothetical protein